MSLGPACRSCLRFGSNNSKFRKYCWQSARSFWECSLEFYGGCWRTGPGSLKLTRTSNLVLHGKCIHKQPGRRRDTLATKPQSVAYRRGSNGCNVHGDPRYFGSECCPPPYRREFVLDDRGIHLGADELPGIERDYPADDRLA